MGVGIADIQAARHRAIPVKDYLSSISKLYRWKFQESSRAYQPNGEALELLKKRAGSYFVLAFSAQWCEECSKHIPVLGLITEATGLEVRVLGGIKTDPLAKDSRWRVPPSPPEVITFGVEKLPWIILFDSGGAEVGKIIESPKQTQTIEEELLFLMSPKG